jgi:hypothetical protein
MTSKIFSLTEFEPVKVKNERYGQRIDFNAEKRYVKFASRFHEPDYVYYDQIERMIIRYDRKRVLLWVGLFTIFLFVGVFILIFRNRYPPWDIKIFLKKTDKPITIRARIGSVEATSLADFCNSEFPTNVFLSGARL